MYRIKNWSELSGKDLRYLAMRGHQACAISGFCVHSSDYEPVCLIAFESDDDAFWILASWELQVDVGRMLRQFGAKGFHDNFFIRVSIDDDRKEAKFSFHSVDEEVLDDKL